MKRLASTLRRAARAAAFSPHRTAGALRAGLAAAAILTVACSDGPPPSDAAESPPGETVVRDSAGVEIREYPAAADPLAWSVATEPRLVIGGEGEGGDFYGISGVLRLPDGRLLVADGGSGEIRAFDPRGRPVATAGGKGRGPGEFEYLGWLGHADGDSIVAWDPVERRLSLFDADLGFVRSVAPQFGGSFPHVVGRLGDGSLVVVSSGGSSVPSTSPDGAFRDSAAYLRVTPSGDVADTLGRFPTRDQVRIVAEDRPGSTTVEDVVFGRVAYSATGDDRLYVAPGDGYEVQVFDASGRLIRILRRAHSPRRVRPADVREYYERLVTVGAPPPSRRDRKRIPVAETFPPIEGMLVDAGGDVWVRETQSPDERDREVVWSVFDASGDLRGTVRTPAGLWIRSIGPDWVIGTALDEDGVERVQIHDLVRDGDTTPDTTTTAVH